MPTTRTVRPVSILDASSSPSRDMTHPHHLCITVTEVRSTSSGLVLYAHHIFANSFNFLVTWGLPVTVFHFMCIFCVDHRALYWPTLQFYLCLYVLLVCWYVAPPEGCYYNTLLRCDYFPSSSALLCTFSACIRQNKSLGIILIPQTGFLSWPPLLS